ncbi:hypothetical protein O181_010613 [Austropuccinia psidii MF-1]|uniref:Uncharacterized protein n=1 Tax=Austropuccinia psidii MF-1 TaxID=1389203 RepID=A0A9Q3BTC3_9BASI|nr:hypothetical protein [Austropuccinia psidii MF-1]
MFFCNLDEKNKATNDANNHLTNPRTRVNIKEPPLTHFPKEPKGLPLEFYDTKWFNSKLPEQSKNLADVGTVAFLKDPTDSLEFKFDDERLGNKHFTDQNWDHATTKYNSDFLAGQELDSNEQSRNEETDYG